LSKTWSRYVQLGSLYCWRRQVDLQLSLEELGHQIMGREISSSRVL
jgi:hypothetical protein